MSYVSQPMILIVSGDRAQSKRLHSYLEIAGYRVREAEQGEAVMRILSMVNPNLALLDWNLPDLNALAITRAIRTNQRFAKLPIIMMGREIGSENKILSLEAGVDLCIEGMVSPKEFMARVRALLRRVNDWSDTTSIQLSSYSK